MFKTVGFRLVTMVGALAVFGAVDVQAQLTPKLDVPFVPTPQETVDRMLSMADIRPDDFLIDLGSGDGRIVITAAQRFGTRGLGIDIDPDRIQESLANASAAGVSHLVEFRNQDLFETDFSRATVLTMYLLPEVNIKLRPRILSELRPGTRVVSHAFDMDDWKPDAETTGPGGGDVFMWIVPARAAGDWNVRVSLPDGGARTYRLELTQNYQELRGTARSSDRNMPVTGRLAGEQIELTIRDRINDRPVTSRVRGRVEGDTITGVMRNDGSSASGTSAPGEMVWQARRISG
ncbi:MAG TPA: class I SAM-dependent methyltransferase [Alphaproteobacteria bacterium]